MRCVKSANRECGADRYRTVGQYLPYITYRYQMGICFKGSSKGALFHFGGNSDDGRRRLMAEKGKVADRHLHILLITVRSSLHALPSSAYGRASSSSSSYRLEGQGPVKERGEGVVLLSCPTPALLLRLITAAPIPGRVERLIKIVRFPGYHHTPCHHCPIRGQPLSTAGDK